MVVSDGDGDEAPSFREAFLEAADGFDNLVAFFETAGANANLQFFQSLG